VCGELLTALFALFALWALFRGVGIMRPVRLRLISASNNCRVKVRIWVRFRVRVGVRVGRLIQVA